MAEPPITRRATFSSFTRGDNLVPTRVVIHATCPDVGWPRASAPGSAAGTAAYFASGNAGGSAHYVCDPGDEQHCVPDDTQAFHAPPNQRSLGIEICAEGGNYSNSYTRAQWLSPQVWPGVARAAARTRELCQRFGIPMVRIGPAQLGLGGRGICGHVDVSQTWHQSNHSDPGPEFPWPEFMALVNPAPAPPKPVRTEEDEMFLVMGAGSPPARMGLLSGGIFRELTAGERQTAQDTIVRQGADQLYVEQATWDWWQAATAAQLKGA